MKKLLALLMALSLVVFTGCSSDKTKTEKSPPKTKTPDDKTKTAGGDNDKEETITGKVTKIDGSKFTVEGKDYDLKDATIEGDRKDVKDIEKDDTVKLTIKGGKVTKAVTTKKAAVVDPPKEKTVTVKGSDIKDGKVKVDDVEYDLTKEKITGDRTALKDIDKDDTVKITVKEGKITKVEATKK